MLDLGNSLGTESDDIYGTMKYELPHGFINDLTTRAIEAVTHQPIVDEEDDDKVTSLERLVEADEEEVEAETLASKVPSSISTLSSQI